MKNPKAGDRVAIYEHNGIESERNRLSRKVQEADEFVPMLTEKVLKLEAQLASRDERIGRLREALRSYAGKGEYSEWETPCRYLTFDKFGGLCEETMGPWEANEALEWDDRIRGQG